MIKNLNGQKMMSYFRHREIISCNMPFDITIPLKYRLRY